MEYICVGQCIKIKRSDGRIQDAVISEIDRTTEVIIVEWCENGKTKGKEVDMAAILELNPDIKRKSIVLKNWSASNLTHLKRQTFVEQRAHRVATNARSMLSIISEVSENVTPPPLQEFVRPQNNATELVQGAGSVNNGRGRCISASNSYSTSTALPPRRSFVKKKVDELKEKRDKLRARQAKMKREKALLKNEEQDNPNWETAKMIREFQSTLKFDPLVDVEVCDEHGITVCVRKRPLSRKEVGRKELDIISVPCKDTLIVHEPRNKVDLTKFLEDHKFRFDYAFDERCDNLMVYKYTAQPLVQTIFDGGMATCFAYGQTGSGKTHTMGGEFNGKVQDYKNGIYAMVAEDVFKYLSGARYSALDLTVSASFFEIYSGKVFDLLAAKKKLRVLEDAKQQVHVVGLTEKHVGGVEDVLKLIQHGTTARTSGKTSANTNSSRSHAVFQIVLRPPGLSKIHGKFSIIDLAGNERGADTLASDRQTRFEGSEINKSLLALKECIRALGKQSPHLPFRVSKLTQVLRDSFIGQNSKTCMIAMISPGLSSCEHTLNTLHYADRVKELVVEKVSDTLRNENEKHAIMDDEKDEIKNNRSLTHNNSSNNNVNNDQNSEIDLALLRSLNELDMPEELLAQHSAITNLQQSEETAIEQHKMINDFITQILPESLRLYEETKFDDYDQEAYCSQGEAIFAKLAEYASNCRNLMAGFRANLAKEEVLSRNMKPIGKR